MPPIVLRILWCTGMRIGEAAALRVGDFSAERRTIYIEHAKHDRSRIIPASGSLADALSRHIAAHAPRIRAGQLALPREEGRDAPQQGRDGQQAPFHLQGGRRAGCQGQSDKDPRHTALLRREGSLGHGRSRPGRPRRAALLSAYMGHANIHDTEYYLRLLPSEHQAIIDQERGISEAVFGGGGQ